MKILEVESFEETFGPKKQRKKPKLAVADVEELAKTTTISSGFYHSFDPVYNT